MSYLKALQEKYPIRKTAAQKQSFRGWAMKQMRQMGYTPRVETSGRSKQQNIIAGEPSRAKVLFIAGYDTPARNLLPQLVFPRNLPLHFSYILLNVLLLLIPAVIVLLLVQGFFGNPRLSYSMLILTYLGELALMLFGPANPHNANKNSSGVAAILELMDRIPEELRDRVAFILFDNSCVGRMGSKAWAKNHVETQYTRLTVCLESVGVGEDFLLISRSLARKSDHYGELEQALAAQEGRTVHFYPAMGSAASSDHSSFKCGALLTTCRRSAGVGFLIGALATPKDTEASEENVVFAADALAAFVGNAYGTKREAQPE